MHQRLQSLLSFKGSLLPLDEALKQRLELDQTSTPSPSSSSSSSSDVKRNFALRVAACMAQESGAKVASDGATVMSVADLALRKTGLEIVVVWWLLPLLVPGVAAPLSRRVKSDWTVAEMMPMRDDALLWNACCFLLQMLRAPFVSGLVRDGHLGDILAALLQLGYEAQSKGTELGKKARNVLSTTLQEVNVDLALEALLQYVAPSKPEWLSAAAGSWLSHTMVRPNAVIALLSLLLDERVGTKVEEGLLSKAAVLVTTPSRKFASNPSKFYEQLSGQLLVCLRHKNESVRFCVALCVERMLRHDPETVNAHFLDKLFAPILAECGSAEEEEFDRMLGDFSLLLVPCGASGGTASDAFWIYVAQKAQLMRKLFLLGCRVIGTASRHNATMMNIISGAMRLPSQDGHRRALAHRMILDISIPNTNTVQFGIGPSGGVIMRPVLVARDWERESKVFCETALDRSPSGIIGDIFAEVLQVACSYSDPEPCVRYLLMMELASELLLVPNLLQDVCQVLVVIKTVLGTEHVPQVIAELLVGVLSELLPKLSGLQEHEMPMLLDVIPALEHAGNRHPSLFAAAATLVGGIKQLNSTRPNLKEPISPEFDVEEALERVLKDLSDPLLPVRAHALVGLRKLVLSRDAATLDKFERVLQLFSAQMTSDDSYLYLGAIQGLAALGDVAASRTIPMLLKDFHNSKLATETRLKVGEALVTIAQRCGEMLPVYAPLLMDGFLRGIQDANPDVRASSLANVGACCEILSWSVHAYIHEVIFAVLSVLGSNEKDQMVRRAAILVFALIVHGLGVSKLLALAKGPLLRDMINRLEILANGDSDDLIKLQASQTLEEFSNNH